MVIAIEGLPGLGKTTSALLLAQRLDAPVTCEATAHHPFLDSVYRDDARYDLEVELGFLLLHSSAWRRLDRAVHNVTDFAPYKDVLFADDMLQDADEHRVFMAVYDRLYAGFSAPDVVVYLKGDPELALVRARARGREFEQGLTYDRLARMKRRYEERLPRLGKRCFQLELDPLLECAQTLDESTAHVADAIARLLDRHGALPE